MAAGFDHLPNEIVLGILDMVLPADLENFAQTSKLVFLLAKPFLQPHRHLIRLYSKTFSTKQLRRDDAFWWAPIPSLLMKICAEPRIAHYIRDVNLEYSGPMRCNKSYYDRDLDRAQGNLVSAAIAQSNVTNIQSFCHLNERLCSKSNESYEEFVVALFLLLLPNLTTLSLPWNPARDYFRDMLRQSVLEENGWFANLTTVRVRGGYVPKGLGVRELSLFSSLPALKALTALGARDHGLTIDDFFPPPDSHTKMLELNGCHFTRLTLYWYLQSFQSLQTFTLAFNEYHDPCMKGQFDSNMVRATLVARAKTTLRSLTITIRGSSNRDTFIGSLQPFEALQHLRTQWTILFPKDAHLETLPSQILPASIRKLQLDDDSGYGSSKVYRAFCRGFRCAKETTCLHLDWVEVGRHHHYWDEPYRMAEHLHDLHGFCGEIGMSVTFQRKSHTSEWQPGSKVMSLTFIEKV